MPVASLTHADVSSAGYRNCTDGVFSSSTSVSLTSSVAATAAVSAGQFVTINGSRGHYAIDAPSGAAGSSLDYAEAVVAFTAGHAVTAIQHEIDLTLSTAAAAQSSAATAASQSTAAAVSAASADTKLSAGRLSRIDRLPDIVAGGSGGVAIVGSEMALPTATLTALFSDADTAALITSITGLFDNAGDLPIQTIAAQAAAATVNALVANGTFTTLVSDASAGKIAAQSADGKLTAGRLGKLDSLTFTTPNVVDASGAGGGGGGGDWTNTEKAQIRYQLGIDGTATAPTAPVTDPVVITPSDTGKTTLYALCVDRRGAAKSGVVVHCWLAGTRPAGSGIIADNLAETFTSGVNGVVQIPDRMLGFSYAVSVNSAENPVIVRISPNAGGTTAIPDLIS